MLFKTEEIKRRWYEGGAVHAKLQTLAAYLAQYIPATFPYASHPVMTESRRTHAETIAIYQDPNAPPSPHETDPLRAFDLRATDLTPEQNQQLVEHINAKFIYDPARPGKRCAVYHKVGDSAYHLHFQVCDATVIKAEA